MCGDSTLTLAILLELARRAWEQDRAGEGGRGRPSRRRPACNRHGTRRFRCRWPAWPCSTCGHRTSGASTSRPRPSALLGLAARRCRAPGPLARSPAAARSTRWITPRPGRPPSSSRRDRRGAGCTRRAGRPAAPGDPGVRPRIRGRRDGRRHLRPAAPVRAWPADRGRGARGHLDAGRQALARVLPAEPPGAARARQELSPAALVRPRPVPPPGQHPPAPLDPVGHRGAGPAVDAGPPGPARQRHRAERGGPGARSRAPSTPAGSSGGWRRAGAASSWSRGRSSRRRSAKSCATTCACSSLSWRTSASSPSSRPAARRRPRSSSASA